MEYSKRYLTRALICGAIVAICAVVIWLEERSNDLMLMWWAGCIGLIAHGLGLVWSALSLERDWRRIALILFFVALIPLMMIVALMLLFMFGDVWLDEPFVPLPHHFG